MTYILTGPGDLSHAIAVAALASRPYVDRQGKPIIRHALMVMLTAPESCAVPAVLHDIVEDTEVTLDDLRAAGFSAEDVDTVDALTRRKRPEDGTHGGEQYFDYVRRCCAAGERARLVKFADLNVNLARIHELPAADQPKLRDRYKEARRMVMDAQNAEG